MMNKKIVNSFILLVHLLTISRLESAQCLKPSTPKLLQILSQKPSNTEVERIPSSRLNPSDFTFNSQYYFVGGTRLDSCNMHYIMRIDESQHKTIKLLSQNEQYIYIRVRKPNEKSQWFAIRSEGITIKK